MHTCVPTCANSIIHWRLVLFQGPWHIRRIFQRTKCNISSLVQDLWKNQRAHKSVQVGCITHLRLSTCSSCAAVRVSCSFWASRRAVAHFWLIDCTALACPSSTFLMACVSRYQSELMIAINLFCSERIFLVPNRVLECLHKGLWTNMIMMLSPKSGFIPSWSWWLITSTVIACSYFLTASAHATKSLRCTWNTTQIHIRRFPQRIGQERLWRWFSPCFDSMRYCA